MILFTSRKLGSRMFGRSPKRLYQCRNAEPVLWGIPISLVGIAGILIASTQRQANYADWYDHWITAAAGVFAAAALARIPLQRLRSLLVPIYILTVVSLLIVRLAGATALGAQRWINIGGIHVQPSEFAKLTAILLVAAVLDRHPVERPVDLIRPISVITVPWLLVFIQPDLGTSLVFGALVMTMLYWSGMPLEWTFLLLSPLVVALLIGLYPWGLLVWVPIATTLAYCSLPWQRTATILTLAVQAASAMMTPWLWLYGLKDYQRDRLMLFLDPSKDPLGGGYHLLQSTVVIGSGGLFGTGLLQGQSTKLRFIPEQHTDFIFSALGEETGFLGTMIVVFGFTLLVLRLLQVANCAQTDFESLVVIGVAAMVMFQVVINIFMTIGLGPITGIPLPFMSYGRSALLVNFSALGFCLSAARSSHSLVTQ